MLGSTTHMSLGLLVSVGAVPGNRLASLVPILHSHYIKSLNVVIHSHYSNLLFIQDLSSILVSRTSRLVVQNLFQLPMIFTLNQTPHYGLSSSIP